MKEKQQRFYKILYEPLINEILLFNANKFENS